MTVGFAAGMLAVGPRDFLYFHAAALAIYPPHPIADEDRNIPKRDEFEVPDRLGIVDAALAVTAGTDRL